MLGRELIIGTMFLVGISNAASQDMPPETRISGADIVEISVPAVEARKVGKLRKMFPFYKKFVKIPEAERNLLNLRYFATSKSGEPFTIWYELDALRLEIPMSSAGEILLRPDEVLFEKNPPVYTNMPKGSGGLNAVISPKLDCLSGILPMTCTVEDIKASLLQANKVSKKVMGLLRVVIPKLTAWELNGIADNSVQLTFSDGRREFVDIEQGERGAFTIIKFDDKANAALVSVTMTQMPEIIFMRN